MHRWVRAITVGAGGVALAAAAVGAGITPAFATDEPGGDEANGDATALVWNDQFATVDVTNNGAASTGGNEATSTNRNVVMIDQGASADASLDSSSRDEMVAFFMSEGFADWMGAGHSIDAAFQVIPGSPVILPVLGGSATNLIGTINNTALGIAGITTGNAMIANSTGVTLAQMFNDNDGASATGDAMAGGSLANGTAHAEVGNTQTADVHVSNNGSASTGGNSARTRNANAVIIGQGASAGASASLDGNANDSTGTGSVEGGTASNTVNSATNNAQGQATVTTGDATVTNSTSVSVTQSNTGNGGATATGTATVPPPTP